ncbi:MAG TPA: hypothetical protein PK858_05455, partial [Saprospiraceae bacterium]|nr:hypothetical protein [Saprospiraceae bacterium]
MTQIIEDSDGMVVGLGTQGAAPQATYGTVFRYDPAQNQMLWAKRLDAPNAQTTSLIEVAAGGNYLINQNPEVNGDRVTEIVEISRAT